MVAPVLKVQDLSVTFPAGRGVTHVVDRVSFELGRGEILGIVGESGSGKSVTCLTIAGLLDRRGRADGEVSFDDKSFAARQFNALPRRKLPPIGMVFQEPSACLNPMRTIGSQIAEAAEVAGKTAAAARAEAVDLLRLVAIPEPEVRVDDYPGQFSGGMLQRVMIAIALAMQPRLIIADEPTTALDVTVQAQIVALLIRIVRERDIPMIFVSHDLDLVAEVCDRIAVMYAGSIAEIDDTEALYERPRHPYTRLLLQAMPGRQAPRERLADIPGEIALPRTPGAHCAFAPRCARAEERCHNEQPLVANGAQTACACFYPWSRHAS